MKVHLRVVSEPVKKYTMPLRYSFKVRCVSNKQQRTQKKTLSVRDRADDVDGGLRTVAEHNSHNRSVILPNSVAFGTDYVKVVKDTIKLSAAAM